MKPARMSPEAKPAARIVVRLVKGNTGTLMVEFTVMYKRLAHRGFTLIELMVVTALMSIAVGMAVFRLDGLGDSGRLRSTASQLASIVRQAQMQACTSGSPRLIEYSVDGARITLHSPKQSESSWRWDSGLEYTVLGGAGIDRILVEGSDGEVSSRGGTEDDVLNIRIGPDGRYIAHAVVLTVHTRWAVVVLRPVERPWHMLLESKPSATSFDLLMLDLEQLP